MGRVSLVHLACVLVVETIDTLDAILAEAERILNILIHLELFLVGLEILRINEVPSFSWNSWLTRTSWCRREDISSLTVIVINRLVVSKSIDLSLFSMDNDT